MRGRTVLRTIRLGPWDPSLLRSLLLALFFLTGAMMGHLYAGACGEEAHTALEEYLRDYCAVYDAGGVAVSMASCIAIYFGYVLLVFLLGFSSAGVALIPALTGLFGFLSMYTVSCFIRCYGRSGVLLALGVLAVRLIFTLPCFLALAGEAWPLSIGLFSLSFGRGKRSAPVLYSGRYFILFLVCVAILTVGVCCERFLTPLLFRLALGRVL